MESYLTDLNEKQREAVLQTDGPVLIVAGAGAGKTKTITHRMFHLMKQGVSPQNILAITFTNKAAREMKERIELMMKKERGDDTAQNAANMGRQTVPFVSTFHALGVHIMRQNAPLLGLERFFSIADTGDVKKMIKEILISQNRDPKQIDPARILHTISREKGNFVHAKQYAERLDGGIGAGGGTGSGEFYPRIVAAVWTEYEKRLRAEHAVDFDDLLLMTGKLLEENAEVREYYQKRWHYIHIDEYQDTNTAQYKIARLLVGDRHNICAVGDTDQNIYSWRGADISNMLRFEKDYPEAKIILLEENYRSTGTIIAAANRVIEKNKMRIEKNLFTRNQHGEKIGLFEGWNEAEEAFFVTGKIRELGNGPHRVKASECAVLYRANFQSRILEEAFAAEGIAYSMVGTKFFERKEIKDVLAFIRASLNRAMWADIERVINVPPRGIGDKTFEKIKAGQSDLLSAGVRAKVENFFGFLDRVRDIATTKTPTDTIKYVIKESGMEDLFRHSKNEQDLDRLENVRELVTLAKRYDEEPPGEGIELLLSDAALASAEETPGAEGEKAEAVKLMTVHAAKGLEFDYVFVTGMEEDLFPHRRGGTHMKAEEAEEERRLFYVALTRARKKVFLTRASMRTVFGERRVTLPSEFLSDIPEEYTEPEAPASRSGGGDGGSRPVKTIYF